MERHNNRRVDPLGKMVLPSALRRDLDLSEKTQVSLMPVENAIIMWRLKDEPSPHCYTSEIDKLGRIEIPAELMRRFNWSIEDEISIYSAEHLVILTIPYH
ncbi:MAG: hypothetical protein FWE05_01695 [Defluviitaleaceae bacterium]|nr:hypothetical protein [Defluviitaleaceae bacterium]